MKVNLEKYRFNKPPQCMGYEFLRAREKMEIGPERRQVEGNKISARMMGAEEKAHPQYQSLG